MKLFKLVLINLYFLLLVDCKSKYYDGPDREYKFGYSIEGNQHRQEQKDANGIIMGEFGFITADGVYHVTGYGTDENGNFKILFMKNIKIGLPGEPGSKPAPTNFDAGISTTSPSIPRPEPVTKRIQLDITRPPASNIASCSNCIIPKIEEPKKQLQQLSPASVTITNVGPKQQEKYDSGSRQQGKDSRPANKPITGKNVVGSNSLLEVISKQQKQANNKNQIVSDKTTTNRFPNSPNTNNSPNQSAGDANQIDSDFDIRNDNQLTKPGGFSGNQRNDDQIKKPGGFSGNQISKNQGSKLGNNAGNINTFDGQEKPKSEISPPDNTFKENTGISGGSVGNVPEGQLDKVGKLSSRIAAGMSKLMTGLLYKFNYTVGYHGHNEQGDTAGAKDGGYYFVGRDGIKRVVNYTANEFGYQPHIKLETAAVEDVPKEETEKEAGLKGYEFKWFNLDDKTRKRK